MMEESLNSGLSDVQTVWLAVQSAIPVVYNQCMKGGKIAEEKIPFLLSLIDRLTNAEFKNCYARNFKNEDSTKEDEHLAFTTWLLGQLVLFLTEFDVESVYSSSKRAQIFILESMLSWNPCMFIQIVSFYLAAIEDLLAFYKIRVEKIGTLEKTSPQFHSSQTFKWFVPNAVSTLPDCFNFEQSLFGIRSVSQCTKLLEQLLKVLASQVFCDINLGRDLWPLALNILDCVSEVNVRLATLDITIQLLQHKGYPENNSLKNAFFQQMEQLLKQACTENHLNSKEDKLWIRVVNLIDEVIVMKGSGSNVVNASLLNTLFIVINNENVSLLCNEFLISMCDFVKYLLNITPEFYETSLKLDSLFCKLPVCPHLFMILEYIYFRKVNLLHSEKSSANLDPDADYSSIQKIDTKSILNTTAIWNRAVNVMEEKVFTKISHNGDSFPPNSHLSLDDRKAIRLLYFFCKTISNLSFEISMKNKVSFLNGKLSDVLKCLMYGLLKDSKPDVTLLKDCLFVLNQVVTISGINNEPPEVIHLLAAFSSLPWILDEDVFAKFPYTIGASSFNLLKTIGLKYKTELCDQNLRAEQLECLAYFSSNICFQWRFALYQTFSNDAFYQRVIFNSLPFMILNCQGSNQEKMSQFLFSIVDLCKRSIKIHLEFSEALPNILCALSFDIFLKRNSKMKLNINCRICRNNDCATFKQGGDVELNNFLKTFTARYYTDFVQGLILETSSSTPELCRLRKNIICSLPFLTNHVPKKFCEAFLHSSMKFMDDVDADNRFMFAKVVKYTIFNNQWLKKVISDKSCLKKWSLSDREVFFDAEPFYEVFKSTCYEVICNSLQSAGMDKQISVMETLLNIGSIPCDLFLWPTVKMLMHYVAHPCKKDIYLSSCNIRQIITAHNMNMHNFVKRYEGEILEEIIFQVVTFKKYFGTSVSKTLPDLCHLFGSETQDFILRHGPNLYKYLFPWAIDWRECEPLFDDLAQLSNQSVKEIILEGFSEIYPFIILHESENNAVLCCNLIERLSGLTIHVLIRRFFLVILANILLNYCVNPIEAKRACLEVKKYDEKTLPTTSKQQTEIVDSLQVRFLGLLVELEFKLTSQLTSDSTKAKILCSLPDIFNLMGPEYITSVRFKVLVTLCTALTLQQGILPSLCIKAWDAFVKIVEVSALGPMLSTIFVSLYPLIDDYPSEISNIFYFLICENEEKLSCFFSELFFLESHPANPVVYEQVQKYLTPDAQLDGENFKRLLRQASHERSEVRLQAFKRLKTELDFYHDEISRRILSNDSLDRLILEILEILTAGSHDSDERVRVASGKCFGELGAIDPGLVPNKISNSDLTKNVPLKVDSEGAIIHLLTTLCQGFQSAKLSRSQDNFALAIQEILKIFSVEENSELLSNFPENFRELMKPLFKSTYNCNYKEQDNSEINFQFPIFGSVKGKTFLSWAFNWINQLVLLISDSQIKEIFKNCKGCMKSDESTIRAFMPFIVVKAIIESTDQQREEIFAELDYVMTNSGAEFLLSNSNKSSSAGLARQFIKPVYCQNYNADLVNELSLNAETCSILCAKVVYGLIDFLFQYARDDSDQTSAEGRKIIGNFLTLFSKEKIAEKTFEFDEFPRALLYLEQHVAEHPGALQAHLPLFGRIYAQLNDADALQGIIAVHTTEPSADEMLLMHEVTGGASDAVVCYEKLAQKTDNNPLFYRNMVQCYLRIDQPFTALKLSDSLMATSADFDEILLGEKVEAMWSMMQFSKMESVLSKPSVPKDESWGTRMGVAMFHVLNNEHDKMSDEISNIYKIISQSLYTSTLVTGGYREGYEYVTKLHILNEVEQLSSLMLSVLNSENSDEAEDIDRLKTLIEKKFSRRLRLLKPLGDILQPVLRVRRVMLSIGEHLLMERKKQVATFFRAQIGKCLLKSIKIARKASHFQMAYSNVLEVEKYKPKELFIEKAQLLWAKKEINQALATLNRGIEIHFSSTEPNASMSRLPEQHRILAKAKLLIACYNEETSNIDAATNTKYFEEAVAACKDIEKSHVCLAQFMDKTVISEYHNYAPVPEKLLEVIKTYSKSMLYGSKYLYQSMSKILSLWLDFAADLAKDSRELDGKRKEAGPSQRKSLNLDRREKALKGIISLIQQLLGRLATFRFLTGFSQLTSRICHPDNPSFLLLKDIIVKCILAYPSQTLWMFMCLHKSAIPLRMKRFNIVLNDAKLQVAPLPDLILKFKKLFEVMSDLCEKSVDSKFKGRQILLDKIAPEVVKLFNNGTFEQIMIPFQKFRTLALPRPVVEDDLSLSEHKPFPDDCVRMYRLKKEVLILQSLVAPKKLTFIGSDGNEYSLLCKPKDDLRLDFRLMEFNAIVNMFLKRDGEARDRDLHIRTYSVAPLINECGLIEWVPNLVCLRPILNSLYKSKNMFMSAHEIKKRVAAVKDPLEKKLMLFKDLKKNHPPVLKEWFFKTFPNPCAWYHARLAYMRTLAVMSIVGFILGLGDRHTENILLDNKLGEIIHVDFNCLFNKGELFDYKEVVPFRLTHNLVDTMGPTGVEGPFVRCCEITNRVMRAHMQLLISVLTPFVYDPLLSWKGVKDAVKDMNGEVVNSEGKTNILNIECRLKGSVKKKDGRYDEMHLSVEGQVRSLIHEAMAEENLAQMFVGWGPYL